MNTYVVYHTDETLDAKLNLVKDVDAAAVSPDIVVLNRFKNIKACFIKATPKGVKLLEMLGYDVVLNQVIEDAEDAEEVTVNCKCPCHTGGAKHIVACGCYSGRPVLD